MSWVLQVFGPKPKSEDHLMESWGLETQKVFGWFLLCPLTQCFSCCVWWNFMFCLNFKKSNKKTLIVFMRRFSHSGLQIMRTEPASWCFTVSTQNPLLFIIPSLWILRAEPVWVAFSFYNAEIIENIKKEKFSGRVLMNINLCDALWSVEQDSKHVTQKYLMLMLLQQLWDSETWTIHTINNNVYFH